jgi:hypothetical protein
MLGVLFEHPDWFVPLFAELDRRELPYLPIPADALRYDPAATSAPYSLVFNRMSPSAYLRGHTRAIFAAQHYLAHLERLGVPVINGSRAYRLELSKARQGQSQDRGGRSTGLGQGRCAAYLRNRWPRPRWCRVPGE